MFLLLKSLLVFSVLITLVCLLLEVAHVTRVGEAILLLWVEFDFTRRCFKGI